MVFSDLNFCDLFPLCFKIIIRQKFNTRGPVFNCMFHIVGQMYDAPYIGLCDMMMWIGWRNKIIYRFLLCSIVYFVSLKNTLFTARFFHHLYTQNKFCSFVDHFLFVYRYICDFPPIFIFFLRIFVQFIQIQTSYEVWVRIFLLGKYFLK